MFDEDTKDTYNWLRHKGLQEVDIPKIIGGHRQYYHKLRKAEGSSEYEMASLTALSNIFEEF